MQRWAQVPVLGMLMQVQTTYWRKQESNKSTEELRNAVDDTSDDGGPNQHFTKTEIKYEPDSLIYTQTCVPLLGHPLVCYTDEKCKSKVRMLRTHHDKLHELQDALESHFVIAAIDKALLLWWQ